MAAIRGAQGSQLRRTGKPSPDELPMSFTQAIRCEEKSVSAC
jgi:hypothetical protein